MAWLKAPRTGDDAFRMEETGQPAPSGELRPATPRRLGRVRKSEVAVILDIDAAASRMLGWESDDVVGRSSLEYIHPADQELAVENWMQMIGSPGPGRTIRIRHKHRDGSWLWLELTNHNLIDDPAHHCIVAEIVDISDEMASWESTEAPDPLAGSIPLPRPLRLHEALGVREQVLHRLAEALPLGVMQIEAHGRIVYTNRRLHTILNTPRANTIEAQFSTVATEDRKLIAEAFEAVLRSGLDSDFEVCLAISDSHGEKDLRQCTMSLRALTADDGAVAGAIACVVDVTDSVRMREELRIRATFDEVTRCHNRASTMDALEEILASSVADTGPAVIFVDLDRFKSVNDRFGHAAGDELLRVVAKRLLSAVRNVDLVGRIGGDEFLVVCPGIATAAQALQAATRVADSLRHQVRLTSANVMCPASIGVAWSTDAQRDADTLIGRADAAMYESKRRGSGRPVLCVGSREAGDWPEAAAAT